MVTLVDWTFLLKGEVTDSTFQPRALNADLRHSLPGDMFVDDANYGIRPDQCPDFDRVMTYREAAGWNMQ
jgi:hypothetical protein